ncbi:hypothetical protein [Shimazuella alba]|jgi:hypothetical protein|uniref:Uncharacterized protein n=1 Tax=Shimazuella alba TaxID=2690964 RepID=A0A6I4VRH1_9BACL|nr:hypothetical protein [Shimazuella alba]MXQ52865.1 hypothetical protein [Shimazuella alba]
MVKELNTTEKILHDKDGNEIPQTPMPAYARDGVVHRLPDEQKDTILYVAEDVMRTVEKLVENEQMKSRDDLRIA